MLNVENILNILNNCSKSKSKVTRLYRIVCNPEFYKLAYSNIYAKPSQMTPASDGSTIDGMSLEKIDKLCEKLRTKTYQPTNLRRINIPKKNGTTRPISIPSFEDKLVQEVCRIILSQLYESNFSDYSHGFRPNRSCHSALEKVRQQFQGTVWFIEGDIKSCFDSIHHETLLNILKEKIHDNRFIHLINLFLKNGYMENQVYHKTYSGTPQGSIISPILCNIYLDKFDKAVEAYKLVYDKGKRKLPLKEYCRMTASISNYKKAILNNINRDVNISRLKDILEKKRNWKGSAIDQMDPNYRRLRYIRYTDDFIIGIIGPKEDVNFIKNEITNYFKDYLKLELSNEKTKITHNSEKVRFLGYDIVSVRNSQSRRENGLIKLSVPYEKMVDFIINNRIGKWWNSPLSGKDELKAIHKPELINNDPLEIMKHYNYKIRGLYNYYKLAENVYKLGHFGYLVTTSYMRTLCNKFKTTRAKLYRNKNFCQNKKVGYLHNGKFYELYQGPYEKKRYTKFEKDIDIIPNIMKFTSRTSLISRLEASECEYCGDTTGPFEDHHIKHMKNIKKGKQNWEKLMIARNRKILHLCLSCHDKLHAGIL